MGWVIPNPVPLIIPRPSPIPLPIPKPPTLTAAAPLPIRCCYRRVYRGSVVASPQFRVSTAVWKRSWRMSFTLVSIFKVVSKSMRIFIASSYQLHLPLGCLLIPCLPQPIPDGIRGMMLGVSHSGQSSGVAVIRLSKGSSHSWPLMHRKRRAAISKLPPSIRIALPLSRASAIFRRAESSIREKVDLETFIFRAHSS
jgi:hypothetical protein